MRGEYVEADFPTRIVFTWGYENTELGVEPGTTRVEVVLTPGGEGTDLCLVHSGITAALPSDANGWDKMLERLAALEIGS